VLLYREREYWAMHQASWYFRGAVPATSPDSPFAPHDVTEEAAAILASIVAESRTDAFGTTAMTASHDLFGLKLEAAEGLGRVLRPIRSHQLGWLVYERLLTDLRRSSEAAKAAKKAAALGAPVPKQAAALDEERIRRNAVRIRAAVEGRGFTRYYTTELAFCESERKASLKEFNAARVPKELRHLVPLARAIGVGDDPCRGLFIRKMPTAERRAAARQVREAGTAIDAWLASRGGPPFDGEAAAFFWLQEAAEEIG
jgi:hypothetical protein